MLRHEQIESDTMNKKKEVIIEREVLTNKNSRLYSGITQEEIDKLNEKPVLFGELGHPDTFDVSLANVSHKIENIEMTEDAVVGDVTILDTKSGRLAKELFESGAVRLGLRGAGTTNEDGTVNIKKIFTWDIIPKEKSVNEDKDFISDIITDIL